MAIEKGSIYIDDAGTPGSKSESKYLPGSRKSWAAVIIPATIEKDVNKFMKMLLDGIKHESGADEFHSSDIYSGRGVWNNVRVKRRIELFETMALMFGTFSLPIIFMTTSEKNIIEMEHLISKLDFLGKDKWWNLRDVSQLGLLRACMEINSNFLQLQKADPIAFPEPFATYIDEGIVKAGTSLDLLFNFEESIKNNKLLFVSSKEKEGIQIADFAAFFIARTQWLMAKQEPLESLKLADLTFLKLWAVGKFNILNLPIINFKPENISRESYEFILRRYSSEV